METRAGREGRRDLWTGISLILVAALLLAGTMFLAGTVAVVARFSGLPRFEVVLWRGEPGG